VSFFPSRRSFPSFLPSYSPSFLHVVLPSFT
jgi:hypothetical protein